MDGFRFGTASTCVKHTHFTKHKTSSMHVALEVHATGVSIDCSCTNGKVPASHSVHERWHRQHWLVVI